MRFPPRNACYKTYEIYTYLASLKKAQNWVYCRHNAHKQMFGLTVSALLDLCIIISVHLFSSKVYLLVYYILSGCMPHVRLYMTFHLIDNPRGHYVS